MQTSAAIVESKVNNFQASIETSACAPLRHRRIGPRLYAVATKHKKKARVPIKDVDNTRCLVSRLKNELTAIEVKVDRKNTTRAIKTKKAMAPEVESINYYTLRLAANSTIGLMRSVS